MGRGDKAGCTTGVSQDTPRSIPVAQRSRRAPDRARKAAFHESSRAGPGL